MIWVKIMFMQNTFTETFSDHKSISIAYVFVNKAVKINFAFLWETARNIVNLLRREGGVRGVFCMFGSYERATPYGVSAFYRLLISRSVLKI